MGKRAHGSEDKEARRQGILDAARRLFSEGDGKLPSAARIAEAAGLAKGTIYIYFRTKEAIYAELLLDGWTEVLREIEEVFDTGANQATEVSAFLVGFTTYLDEHPELMRLDALGPAVIERNLEPDTFAAFKRSLNERLASGGATMDRALGLPPGRGTQLLMRTYAFTRGMWLWFGEQADKLSGPAAPSCPDFRSELADALEEYWQGALAKPAQ